MYELLPIVGGASIGLAVTWLDGRRARTFVAVAASVIVGVAAAVLSGETEESWGFVLWDTAQALIAALLVNVIAARWLSRREASAESGA